MKWDTQVRLRLEVPSKAISFQDYETSEKAFELDSDLLRQARVHSWG